MLHAVLGWRDQPALQFAADDGNHGCARKKIDDDAGKIGGEEVELLPVSWACC